MNTIELGIKITADGSGQVKADITDINSKLAAMGKAGADAGAKNKKAADDGSKSYGLMADQIKAAKTALLGYISVQAAWQGSRAILDATVQMERLKGMMEAASGSAAASAQNLRFVDQTAKMLGINLIAASEGFASLTAATRGTGLEGKATRDIFTSVSRAAAALGKSAADTQGIIMALTQIVSKNTVSMEELRQQLGERLPGAFRAAAQAMGVTTAELDKMVSSGQLTATEFLPKLAKALDETYSGARMDRLNNQIERLDGSWTKFKANILDSNGMSKAIGNLADMIDKLNGVLNRSKAFGGDPFQILPGKAQIQQALAGQTSHNPLEPFDVETLNRTTGAVNTATQSLKGFNDMQRKIYEASIKYKLDPAMMLGLAQRESAFNPKATNPNDGGRGLFQFMPKTWAGVQRQAGKSTNFDDAYDPDKQIDAAMRYMTQVKKIVWNSRGMADLVAAWNYGPERMVRAINKGRAPEDVTTKGHVPNVMRNAENWQKRLAAIPDGDLKQVQETGKEIEKYQADQYKSYVEHLKARESAFEDYSKTALAEQRTMMERLNAAQQDAEQKAKAAMAGGDLTAIRAAEAQQRKFLEDKKSLLLQGIAIEEEATRKKIANIGMEIAQAQKLNQYEGVDRLRQQRSSELAELAALAERRKQIEIGAAADIAKVQREFDDEKRQADRQRADDFVKQLEEQRQANEDAYRQMQQVMELRMAEAANMADARKQDIDNQIEYARAETAAAQASRQASLEGLSGIEAQQKAREILNANLRDTLDLIDLEKTKALEKLVIDGDILASQRQLLEVYKEIADQQGNKGQALAIEKQLQDIYAGQAKNIRDRVAAQSKAAAEAAKAQIDNSRKVDSIGGDQVKEEQLRLNAWWDQYMGRLRDYATLWEQITGNTSDGWAQMTLALGEYQKQFSQIQQYWQSDAGKSWGDLAPMMEVTQQAQAALAGMAKTLIAMRSNYAEGTQGYKDMTAAAERMMEVQRVAAVVEGVMGVLHQLGSGDPYTAPARAAMASMIVAAQLAAIGMSAAQVPGFSNRQAQKASQAGGSTSAGGGVFGDTSAKSDSITKSLEIVSQNSTADLAYSAGMLRALTDIKYALMGTTNAVIRNVGPQLGLNLKAGMGTDIARGMLDPIGSSFAIGAKVFGDPISKLMAKLSQFLLNTTKKITDWGLAATQQTLGDIMKGGFQGQGFTDVTTTTKVLGITVQKSTKRYFAELNGAVNSEFTRAIVGVANTVAEAGKAFGLGAKDFEDRLKGFVVNFSAISTKGLKGQELQDALTQMFSAMSDDMARAFLPGLDAFMQSGEGYLTTLVRVADGINRSTGILEQAGLKAINYQDIILKQGDVAAEIIRQSIVAFEGIGSAIGAYVDQAVGSAEELMAVYQDLLIISDTAKLTGFNLADLSNALIVTSGGVAKFLENITTYQTEILGGSDYARQMLTLTREFGKLGKAVPANNEAFVKLVDSIDTSTEAGQKLYAQILALAGAFSKAQQEAQKLEELRAKYLPTDSLKGYRDQIKQVDDDFRQIIEGSLARMPGGSAYLNRTGRIATLTNRIETRTDRLNLIQDEIDILEAKAKLTGKEKNRLGQLRAQRKFLNDEIAAIDKQIAKLNEQISKNPKSKSLLEERAKLLEEQGDAVIKVLADIWDSMTQAVNNAKETLKSIQDSIFELAGGAGSEDIKFGMANARRITAEKDYTRYTENGGKDIVQLQKFADAYYKAIMDEYQARMDLIEAPKAALEKERELRQKAHDEQIQALEKELGKVIELRDAVESIRKYALDLKLGGQSTLSPKQLLDESRKQYTDILTRAQGGDVKAMQELTAGAGSYLEAAKKYYGSGGQYGAIYDGVLKAMEGLGAMNPGDSDSIQARIDALNEDHEKYLKSIDDQIAALKIDDAIRALQDETAKKLQALADDLGPRISNAEKQAAADMQKLIDETIKTNDFNQRQLDALNEMLKGWGMKPIEQVKKDLAPPPSGTGGITTPGMPTSPIGNIIMPGAPTLPAYASGGFAQPGYAIVGENGPELVRFASAAQVYDAEKTKKMLQDMVSLQVIENMPRIVDDTKGKPINLETMPRVVDDIRQTNRDVNRLQYTDEVVAELRALQREVKALVTTQSGANPEIISELATLNRRMESIERTQRVKP